MDAEVIIWTIGFIAIVYVPFFYFANLTAKNKNSKE